MRFSASILAGGESRRMGTNKALLKLGDRSMFEYVLSTVSRLQLDEIFAVGDQRQALSVTIVPDRRHKSGPVAGLEAALQYAQSEHVLLLACDMPYVQPEILQLLLDASSGGLHNQAVVPAPNGRWQGLPGVFHRSALGEIAKQLDVGNRSMNGILSQLNVRVIKDHALREVDPNLRSFTNINTPQDLVALSEL